ncbi:MAG: peptide deformylase, partial [Planctomycetota bacterium]
MDPASLRIVEYPHPALRAKTEEIPTPCAQEVRDVAQRMLELMREAEGVGLAAPQVNLPW